MHENRTQGVSIMASDVTKRYGAFAAVNAVSLQIHEGEVFGILGPNGAGKTTLLECIVGMRQATSGSVQVLGLDLTTHRNEIKHFLSIQPQYANLFDHLTVTETLELFASFYQDPLDLEDLILRVGLDEKRREQVRRLSGGQKQRLLVATALVGNTKILFLDEPTGSLDPQARRQIWDVIRERKESGRTIVLTTHSMEEAQALSDRVGIMNRGRLIAVGTPQELIDEHMPEKLVVFEQSTKPDVPQLESLPGIINVLVTPSGSKYSVKLRTNQVDETLRILLNKPALRPQSGFRMEQATLEDVFLALVGSNEGGGGVRRAKKGV